MYGKCYELSIKIWGEHQEATILRVEDYKGGISLQCDPRWLQVSPDLWIHHVVLMGGEIHDPSGEQFGFPTIYPIDSLIRNWEKIYEVG